MDGGLDGSAAALRRDLRHFLGAEISRGGFDPQAGSFARFDAGFAARLGAAGFIGIDWPADLGGQGGSALDRQVVAEELLAHGAPVRAHWAAEWLAGPLLRRAGTPAQQQEVLPRIAGGGLSLCIGLEEAAVGPDPMAMRSRAVAVGGGWRITGRKSPVADAGQAQRMILLARTAPPEAGGAAGLTLFLVDLALPGITRRPLPDLAGSDAAAEVELAGVFVAADRVIGAVDEGWPEWLAVAEAALGAPDGWMRVQPLLAGLLDGLGIAAPAEADAAIGRLVAGLYALHGMGLDLAARDAGAAGPALLARLASGHAAAVPEAVLRLLPTTTRRWPLSRALLAAPGDAARAPAREALWHAAARRLRPGRPGR